MPRFIVAASVLLALVSGCGGRASSTSPIEKVDRPAAAALARAFGPASGSQPACTDLVTGAMSDCHGAASSLSRRAPRLFAALPLAWPRLPGYEGLFLLFRTGRGGACFDVQIARRDGVGAGPLKCLGRVGCGDVCLTPITKQGRTLLGGTVAPDARELTLVFGGRDAVAYRLDGPTAPALAGQRIFMADLGTRGAPDAETLAR